MNDKIVVKNINNIKAKYKKEHGYEFNKYEVTERKDFSQTYICFYEIMPGHAAYPKHYHSYNTECFYIIEGNGIVETIDSKIEVKAGDVIVFPCGKEGTHKLINTSDKEKLVYIDFDTTNSPDIIHYVDSDKIGIIEHNISSTFYRNGDNVDYYDGEK
ncbi:MAG: cupin domain-containing protein [Erysipelotrichales bacterium]|nr:cupin domain-containing protein [Erysipelotrichales bacterium]